MASIFSSLLGIGESSPRVAPTGTVVTEEKLATEIAPFYKDLLAKSQALHDARLDEGFQPYQGQTVADFTPDELRAREGIRGLVGSQQADYDEARRLYDLQTEKFTADTAQEYLNPYQQAVTDVALRKADEDFSRRVMPKFEKFASDAGGMSGLGSRAGVQAGGLGEAFMQNLSDIQTKGSATGFADARAAFEAQKRREGLTASRLPQLAGQEYSTRARELAGLTAIGEDERARTQTSLDEDYKEFLEERRFPEDQLQRYQSTIQGFPNIKSSIETKSTQQPTAFNRFLSSASGLGSLYGTFGGFEEGGFGSAYKPPPVVSREYGGLVGLPVIQAQQGIYVGEGFSSAGRTGSEIDAEEAGRRQAETAAAAKAAALQEEQARVQRAIATKKPTALEELVRLRKAKTTSDIAAAEGELAAVTQREEARVPSTRASQITQVLKDISRALATPMEGGGYRTLGQAAGVAATGSEKNKAAERKRQDEIADERRKLKSGIERAKSQGDFDAAKLLVDQSNILTKLNTAAGQLYIKQKTANFNKLIKKADLDLKVVDTISKLTNDIIMQGAVGGPAVVRDLIQRALKPHLDAGWIDQPGIDKIMISAISAAGPISAKEITGAKPGEGGYTMRPGGGGAGVGSMNQSRNDRVNAGK